MGSEQHTATQNEKQPKTSEFQRVKNKVNIETIDKLRQFGLSDEQISEALNIPLEQLKQVDLDE